MPRSQNLDWQGHHHRVRSSPAQSGAAKSGFGMPVTSKLSTVSGAGCIAALFTGFVAAQAHGQTNPDQADFTQASPVVVELYTSQGCAACPPADELLEQLAQREDVIALALHVDYWDYIGWVDSFGQPAFSARQKTYARRNGRASVFTPQMVINGQDEVKGSAQMAVMSMIYTHLAKADSQPATRITISAQGGGHVHLQAEAAEPFGTEADVQLVRYTESASVLIEGGENEGLYVTYHNIVTSWQVIGQWDGTQPFQRDLDTPGDGAVVIIVQEKDQGRILAAARKP